MLDPATPSVVVDGALRAMGLDPAAVRARGRALGVTAMEKKRRGWMDEARARIEQMKTTAKATTDYLSMSKQMLLAELERWRQHPSVGGEVRAAFRNRRPEESSEDDLRSLLEEIERVAAMHDADGETPKSDDEDG
ncbi:MAG: hypothetical protein U0234_17950 [Sandaracinus sp.]